MPAIDSTLRPKLKAPTGTCDTHMHVYDPKYPRRRRPPRSMPPAATVSGLPEDVRTPRHRSAPLLVQPSTYGKDNRCTLEAVAAMRAKCACVVVVDQGVTDS